MPTISESLEADTAYQVSVRSDERRGRGQARMVACVPSDSDQATEKTTAAPEFPAFSRERPTLPFSRTRRPA